MRTLLPFILFWPLLAAAAPGDTTVPVSADTAGPAAPAPAAATVARDTAAPAAKSAAKDSAALAVSRNTAARAAKPAAGTAKDSAASAPKDSINVFSATIIGAGVGLSLGSIPVISTWKRGLPASLADLGLTAVSFAVPGDSSSLAITVKENPDVYNMTFPLSVYVCRLSPLRRMAGGLSFSMQSKEYIAGIIPGTDSLRHLDLTQSLGLYTLTFDFIYGFLIPPRYFSIDKMDRTDAVLGFSLAPYIAFSRTYSLTSTIGDPRMTSIRDTIEKQMSGFTMQGIALAWRAGIITLHRVSRTDGMDASLSYFGLWCTRFRNGGSRLYNRDISSKAADPDKEVSYFSNRFEITFSLVRKLWQKKD